MTNDELKSAVVTMTGDELRAIRKIIEAELWRRSRIAIVKGIDRAKAEGRR